MTSRPQPGRPDPYNSQGTPGQYGQQPLNRPYGQYGQANSSEQNPYGQQQYGGQAGYPGGRPPRSRKGAIIAIVVAGLVLGGGGVTAWLLSTDDGPSTSNDGRSKNAAPATPRTSEPIDGPTATADTGGEEAVSAAAQAYLDAVNNQDEPAAIGLMCTKADPGLVYHELAGQVRVEKASGVTITSATTATVNYAAQGDDLLQAPLLFSFIDGAWCVTL
jgi:hypothetical protein